MIYLAKRLSQYETDADKEEFIRGAVGLTPQAGERKVIAGFVAGFLLSKVLRKNG